jgi:hypothetical protein
MTTVGYSAILQLIYECEEMESTPLSNEYKVCVTTRKQNLTQTPFVPFALEGVCLLPKSAEWTPSVLLVLAPCEKPPK